MQVAGDVARRPGRVGDAGLIDAHEDVEARGGEVALSDVMGDATAGIHLADPIQGAGGGDGLGGHKDGCGAGRDGEGVGVVVEAGGLDNGIGVGGVGLDGVQAEAVGSGDGDGLLNLVGVEEDQDVFVAGVQVG